VPIRCLTLGQLRWRAKYHARLALRNVSSFNTIAGGLQAWLLSVLKGRNVVKYHGACDYGSLVVRTRPPKMKIFLQSSSQSLGTSTPAYIYAIGFVDRCA